MWMKVAAGKVVNGRVEVEGLALPEGVDVIIGFPESAEVGFELTESDEDLLAAAIAEADRGEFADTEAVMAAIRRARPTS